MTPNTILAAAALSLATSLLPLQVAAATDAPRPKAAAKPAKTTTAQRPAAAKEAKATPGSTLSEGQLAAANRVLTGKVDCEFQQTVMVEPHAGRAGHFQVKHNRSTYTMVPEETTTGAVRLVDTKAGVVWLQIPVKSMMMNTRAGRRMVDACTHPTQRQAQAEADSAAASAAAAAAAPPATAVSPTLSQSVRAPEPAASAPAGALPPAGTPTSNSATTMPIPLLC